ncbi:two-component system KDP operon response regulator KdpE [Silvibacterium bohemicum]|uniref:Two-component system KDP operon response regulator KdpE n=1 Tax=Silvibacterium bohemicum TaxID=1577686 RepID=A0A841K1R4_9BACT|nr:response regulator transcription factor [Silvibacterium bohemicum]MBB6145889.1 two-component system KDP operon response regulator KdpE [Silvibacterium bohemicum]
MRGNQKRVFVIAEAASACSQLQQVLLPWGFDARGISGYENALASLYEDDYDAILLDYSASILKVSMVCKELRKFHSRLPILVVGVSNSLNDKIAALDAGADDYIVRPFSEPVFAAQLRSAIRSFRALATTDAGERLVVREIVLDTARHRVEKSGAKLSLSPTEFRALKELMQQPGIPISHSALIVSLWGQETKSNRQHLRVLIRSLRKKLETNPSDPRYLITHAYVGYYFRDC